MQLFRACTHPGLIASSSDSLLVVGGNYGVDENGQWTNYDDISLIRLGGSVVPIGRAKEGVCFK